MNRGRFSTFEAAIMAWILVVYVLKCRIIHFYLLTLQNKSDYFNNYVGGSINLMFVDAETINSNHFKVAEWRTRVK